MTALTIIHMGLKQLGIAEDDARDLYERMTGERSLRAMTPSQRKEVIEELRRMGFRAAPKCARKPLEGKYAAKLQALWIAGYNLNLIRERDDAALLTFVKRQTGIDHTRFLRYAEDASKSIEALKRWLERDGGIDWSKDRSVPEWTQANGYRIAIAQHRRLLKLGLVVDTSLEGWLAENGFAGASTLSDRTWIAVMNKLGSLIRQHNATTMRGQR